MKKKNRCPQIVKMCILMSGLLCCLTGVRAKEVFPSIDGTSSNKTRATNITRASDNDENNSIITLELTDSYGDGWNGNYISVVDVESGSELDRFTITSGSNSQYTLAIPNGREIQFQWISGNYANECSYVVTDEDGEVIFSGSGAMSAPINYTPAKRPANLAAENITKNSATITWTGHDNALSYSLRYRKVSLKYDFESAEPWVVDDFAPFTTYDGDGLDTYSLQGVTFDNQGYTGSVIAFQNGISSNCYAHSGNAFGAIMDNDTQNDDWLISPEIKITEGMAFSFWARSLNDSYGLERIKVGVYGSTDGTFSSYLEGSENSSTEVPVAWTEFHYDLSAYVGQTIKLAINCVSADVFALFIDDICISTTWSETFTDATSPFELSSLEEGSDYEVQVKTIYDGKTSDWAILTFKTAVDLSLDNDATDNSDILASYEGFTANVTLANRIIYRDGKWNTICLPFEVDLTDTDSPLYGATAKTLNSATMEGTHVKIDFGEPVNTLEAGVPYIIKWETPVEGDLENPVFNSVVITSPTSKSLTAADGHVKFVGYYDAFDITPDDYSIYYMTATSQLKHTGTNRTLKSLRAYFNFTANNGTNAKEFSFDINFDSDATSIKSIGNTEQNNNDDSWYTLSGERLNNKPTKRGVYLNNKRKIIIK